MGLRHQSFLEFKQYRYLKLAVAMVVLSIMAYAWHRNTYFFAPGNAGYGGTSMGYALGGLASILVLWLLWLGVRKRRYRASSTSLQGWVSAHVYLGLATWVIAVLHSGFELGFNLHSLTLFLLTAVVISGIYGVFVYVRVPPNMTDKIGEDSLESLLLQIRTIDMQARKAALSLSDEFNSLIEKAAKETRLSGAIFDVAESLGLRACPTDLAVDEMQALVRQLKGDHVFQGREVFSLMVSRQAAVRAVRHELRSMARLKRWLIWHVPMSIALLAALLAHVLSVFIYW